ncbi:MAG: GyrI-like domain-containing protein [Chloroflexota bacterium]
MAYECTVIEQPACPTLAARIRVPAQDMTLPLGDVYAAIRQYLAQLGEAPAGPPFAAYANMSRQNLDVELGFPVARALRGKGGIKVGEIPASRYATCLHVGPYGELDRAYAVLNAWLQAQGHQATGVAYEFYLDEGAPSPAQPPRTQLLLALREE